MNDGTYLVLAIVVWLLLVAVRSIRIESESFSEFELQRRAKAGDGTAIAQQNREERLPDVRALSYLIETVLLAALVALLVVGFGLWFGILFATVALLVLPLGTRLKLLANFANRFYQKHESGLLGFVARRQGLLKWLRQNSAASSQAVHSREELLHLARQAQHVFTPDELTMLGSVLEFEGKTVADVMTPRSVVDSVDVSETAGPLILDTLHKTGHSRFPVTDKDIDHVVGMLYMRDMVPLSPGKKKIKDAMRPEVFYVRNDQTLEHALHAFLRTHHHLFIVVNEFRETVGLLSLEDVIETLIGRRIVDEFDAFDDLRKVAESNPRKNNQPNKREDI